MPENQMIDHDEMALVLESTATNCDASEIHGFLCGLICASGYADPSVWLVEIFDHYNPADSPQHEVFERVNGLYQNTLAAMNSPEMAFELLLPDDEEGLPVRTELFGHWCLGFTSGLGIGGIPDEKLLSEEIQELLRDLSDIVSVEFDVEEASEEDEVALQELIEYVRVGVLFIYDEFQPATAPTQVQ